MPNAYILNQKPLGFGPAMSTIVEMLISAGWTYKASGTGTNGFVSPAATTVTISAASPAVVTWTGSHGLTPAVPIVFTSSGSLPPEITSGVTYYVLASGFTTTTFQISATQGGAAINTSNTGTGTHTGTVSKMFTSSVASGTPVKISNASPAVIYWPNHGQPVGSVLQFASTNSLPSGISTSTNYFVLSTGLTANSFQISATVAGAAINTSSFGFGSQSVSCFSGWGNANSWARVQDPGGGREFIFQHNNTVSSHGARIKYSASAKFTGASNGAVSATNPPTATDERYLWGTNSGVSTTWMPDNVFVGDTVFQGAAMAAAPYGFWFACQTPGTQLRWMGMLLDPVVSVAEDPDPCVIHITGTALTVNDSFSINSISAPMGRPIGTSGTWTQACGGSNPGNYAYMDIGKTAFLDVQPLMYTCHGPSSTGVMALVGGSFSYQTLPGAATAFIGVNQFNSQPDALPVAWARAALTGNTTACAGLKGWSTMMRWTTVIRGSFVDTLDNKTWVCVGPFWLPWDGVTTPRND